MIFENTDILCVAAGLGATYAAANFPTHYYEAKSVSDAIDVARRNQHRYVLLDADVGTRAELDAKGVDYVIILPSRYCESEWVARWLKAGSSAKIIKARLARWAKIMNDAIYEDSTAPVAIIRYTQWLGEMLALTEPDKTDKEDV